MTMRRPTAALLLLCLVLSPAQVALGLRRSAGPRVGPVPPLVLRGQVETESPTTSQPLVVPAANATEVPVGEPSVSPGSVPGTVQLVQEESAAQARARSKARLAVTSSLMLATSAVYATNTLLTYFRKQKAEAVYEPILEIKDKISQGQVAQCIAFREIRFQVMMFQYSTKTYEAVSLLHVRDPDTSDQLKTIDDQLVKLQLKTKDILDNAVTLACFPNDDESAYFSSVHSIEQTVKSDIARFQGAIESNARNFIISACTIGIGELAVPDDIKENLFDNIQNLAQGLEEVSRGGSPKVLAEKFAGKYIVGLFLIKAFYEAKDKDLVSSAGDLLQASSLVLAEILEAMGQDTGPATVMMIVGKSLVLAKAMKDLSSTIQGLLVDNVRYENMHSKAQIHGEMFAREQTFKMCALTNEVVQLTDSQNNLFRIHQKLLGLSDGGDLDMSAEVEEQKAAAEEMKARLEEMCMNGDTQLCYSSLNRPQVIHLLESILSRADGGGDLLPTIEKEALTGPITDFAVSTTEEQSVSLRSMGFSLLNSEPVEGGKLLWYCRACDKEGITKAFMYKFNPYYPDSNGDKVEDIESAHVLRVSDNAFLVYWMEARFPTTKRTRFLYEAALDQSQSAEEVADALQERYVSSGMELQYNNDERSMGFWKGVLMVITFTLVEPTIYVAETYFFANYLTQPSSSSTHLSEMEGNARRPFPVVGFRVVGGICGSPSELSRAGWTLEYSNANTPGLIDSDTGEEDPARRREVWVRRASSETPSSDDRELDRILPNLTGDTCIGENDPAGKQMKAGNADLFAKINEDKIADIGFCSMNSDKCKSFHVSAGGWQYFGRYVHMSLSLDVYVKYTIEESAEEALASPSISTLVSETADRFTQWKCYALNPLIKSGTCKFKGVADSGGPEVYTSRSKNINGNWYAFWHDGMGTRNCEHGNYYNNKWDDLMGVSRAAGEALYQLYYNKGWTYLHGSKLDDSDAEFPKWVAERLKATKKAFAQPLTLADLPFGKDKDADLKKYKELYELDCRTRVTYPVRWMGDGNGDCLYGRTVSVNSDGVISEKCDAHGTELHVGPVYIVEVVMNSEDRLSYDVNRPEKHDITNAARNGWYPLPREHRSEEVASGVYGTFYGTIRIWAHIEDVLEPSPETDAFAGWYRENCEI